MDSGCLNLVSMVFSIMEKRKLTFCSCESLTGGLFGATVCSVPGASNYYRGGVITYVDDVKQRLGVSEKTLKEDTAISMKCVCEMALSSEKFTGSDVAISFTGNAGPTAQDGKPVGEVWIGISYHGQAKAYKYQLEGDRNSIREQCVKEGLRQLLNNLA